MKHNFLPQQKSQKSRIKSVTDAGMNTANTDFWKGKIHSKETIQSVS